MEDIFKKVKWVINSDISAYEISKHTSMTKAAIASVRRKQDDYDYSRMSVQNAISLANYYDDIMESSKIFQDNGGFISFTSLLDTCLTKISNTEETNEMKVVINKLKDLTLKDMDVLQELYHTYKETIKGEKL